MAHAQQQAFSLPEILENILLQLPVRDLLVNAQLVCRDWNTAIKSPTLQRALFFLPVPGTQIQYSRFNPLLRKVFSPWFSKTQKKNVYARGKVFKDLDWYSSHEKIAAYAIKEASWRRMLPVQPPATTFQVDAVTSSRGGGSRRLGELQFEDGVRMGTLYDYAQKTVSRPISSFWVEWNMFPKADDDENSDTPFQEDAAWKPSPKVTMHTRHTVQCRRGMAGDVGPEFKSEGYQDLEITFVTVPRRR
ncbi:uncharacterized protein PAC_02719 [Phialocephala subalpina]|uniref:F-box domain-containing protein n=1 Tax=Phialocephala subalpina TaxID=576137 RepID=A0A1L7WJA0_9HELO|nr:uncharacterized protein PAC_02719 [Phialocephala subalpina]